MTEQKYALEYNGVIVELCKGGHAAPSLDSARCYRRSKNTAQAQPMCEKRMAGPIALALNRFSLNQTRTLILFYEPQ